ncbi:peptidoglycan-binding domain-containing protein [Streptomyces sp. ISL-111]|uniref:peptidoglycan-binding protein n=1 Tax=unclassified Streptomyces TaxID=2593676 RepID=UPI001BE53335|nr:MULTISPECIES: peptidoglycan-binding protein [unclassified Streptomyces]MBT2381971.1 peptidoglycan-binding domain-containing protein [Streptomyces sp. ISL-111]MBT2427247.1 peptidoglycan-binding domain-containing protein [Streptomyces sp. ISL-112]MBT2465737.1 peptidoglycan-binding domain-containing protein [Streptomyces sp. ISL-63]
MSLPIISRATWGARPWNGTPDAVPLSKRTSFFVHYDGANHVSATGHAVPRAIDRQHQAQGWSGIGYNFVVDHAGNIYEGRGWDRQGAHCPGHNVTGLGVQIAVGGDQEPSEAALAACRALYDEACRRTGHALAMRGHRDGIATLCPGTRLYAWVRAGMPAKGHKPPTTGTPGVARHRATINGLSYGYGAHGAHVTRVGEALVARGHGAAYEVGPGPTWTDADTTAYAAYQRSLGYTGPDADGVPGTTSLRRLLGTLPSKTTTRPKPKPPAFPDRAQFGPGKRNHHVTRLGEALVAKGYRRFYKVGPGPAWSNADRNAVRAFQRAQGWTGADADGYPGPETWRRLVA